MASGMIPDVSDPGKPSPAAIREQLERMLASKAFVTAPRLSRYLKFGVEAALAGGEPPNEYSIGMDAFERPSRFDPRVDPIVRVHARRLRSKLAEYYSSDGAEDTIAIYLPLRSYIPAFAHRTAPARTSTPGRQAQVSSIAVFPFVSLSADLETGYFATGLTHEVIHSLSKIGQLRVVSLAGQEKGAEPRNLHAEAKVETSLSGTIRRAGARIRISAELLNVADGTVLWSNMYEVAADDFIGTQEKIATEISHQLSLPL